ncbi:MAG: RDD family protein, partial [Candidatus Eremiobacteraeota bacterium]|nr:RDD family protein [Candidatus Eremiobacteraeota bacterium]
VARAAAVLLDYVIVQGVNTHGKFVDVNASVKPADVRGMASIVKSVPALNWLSAHIATVVSLADVTFGTLIVLAVYSAILVTLTGRTLGMMVVGLRVVTSRFGRVNGVRAAVRYTLAALSAVSVVPLLASVFFGMPIYDRLSGTRVVQGAD